MNLLHKDVDSGGGGRGEEDKERGRVEERNTMAGGLASRQVGDRKEQSGN